MKSIPCLLVFVLSVGNCLAQPFTLNQGGTSAKHYYEEIPYEVDSIPSLKGIPSFYKCWGVEGVIGSNLLRSSIVFINPSDHIIVLTDQIDRIPVDPKRSIPLVTNIGQQILTIDDKEYEHVDLCDIITGKIVLIGKDSAIVTIRDGQGVVRKISIDKM